MLRHCAKNDCVMNVLEKRHVHVTRHSSTDVITFAFWFLLFLNDVIILASILIFEFG